MEDFIKNLTREYIPIFWINKAVYNDKYISTINEALMYSAVLLLVEHPNLYCPTRMLIQTKKDFAESDNMIKKLINEKGKD